MEAIKNGPNTNEIAVEVFLKILPLIFHQRFEIASSLSIENNSATNVAEGKNRKNAFFPIKGTDNHETIRIMYFIILRFFDTFSILLSTTNSSSNFKYKMPIITKNNNQWMWQKVKIFIQVNRIMKG